MTTAIAFEYKNYVIATKGVSDMELDREYIDGYRVLDVRSLKDEWGNSLEDYKRLIDKGISYLEKDKKLVVCCTAGISRSNAIAIGILMKKFNMSFNKAFDIVTTNVKYALIERAHINNLKKLEKELNSSMWYNKMDA